MDTIMTPRVRRIAYAVYAIIGLALGAVQVGFAAAEAGQPVWLTVALAVFAFLGAGLGFTATTHTSVPRRSAEG